MNNYTFCTVTSIFSRARRACKNDIRVYESFKNEIKALPLTNDEYERLIRQLTKILRV